MKKHIYVELNHFSICMDTDKTDKDEAVNEILDKLHKAINDADIGYDFKDIEYTELSN